MIIISHMLFKWEQFYKNLTKIATFPTQGSTPGHAVGSSTLWFRLMTNLIIIGYTASSMRPEYVRGGEQGPDSLDWLGWAKIGLQAILKNTGNKHKSHQQKIPLVFTTTFSNHLKARDIKNALLKTGSSLSDIKEDLSSTFPKPLLIAFKQEHPGQLLNS